MRARFPWRVCSAAQCILWFAPVMCMTSLERQECQTGSPAAASKAVSTQFLEDPECADITRVTRYTVSAITCF